MATTNRWNYGASEQVAFVMSHVVFLLPGDFGAATPVLTVKLVQALFWGVGTDIEESEAAT